MKISIITAVFNRRDTVAGAIRSLQMQTHSDYEHIVADGGSNDGTVDVLHELADARAHIKSEPDKGIYDALNKGMARATGDVIGVLHSDDFFSTPEVLAKVNAVFERTGADAVYGDLDYVSATDTSIIIRHWTSGAFERPKLRRGWMPPHPATFIRREVFDKFGGYDTSYTIAADYDAILRWFGAPGFSAHYVPEVLVKMRAGGVSNRSLSNIIRKSKEDYRALKTNRMGGAGALLWKNLQKSGQFLGRKKIT